MAQRQISCHTVKRTQFQVSAERPNALDQQICNTDACTGHYHCPSVSPPTFNLRSKVSSPFQVNVSFDLETDRPRRILNKRSLFDVQRTLCKPKLRRGFIGIFCRCLTVYTMYLPHANSRVCVPHALFILYLVTLPHLDRTHTIFVK